MHLVMIPPSPSLESKYISLIPPDDLINVIAVCSVPEYRQNYQDIVTHFRIVNDIDSFPPFITGEYK